jgi:hypothetical protein
MASNWLFTKLNNDKLLQSLKELSSISMILLSFKKIVILNLKLEKILFVILANELFSKFISSKFDTRELNKKLLLASICM